MVPRPSGILLTCKSFRKTQESFTSLKRSQLPGAGLIIERKKTHDFHRAILYHGLISKTYTYVVHPIQIYTDIYRYIHTNIYIYTAY